MKLMRKLALLLLILAATATCALADFDVTTSVVLSLDGTYTVDNNKDGTVTVHMPQLSATTYGGYDYHYGYATYACTFNVIGRTIGDSLKINGHKTFSEKDFTIDITECAALPFYVVAHVSGGSCPWAERLIGQVTPAGSYKLPVRINYDLNGGSVGRKKDSKFEYLFQGDTLQTTFEAPIKAGATFEGWYTAAEGGDPVTTSTATSETTYYAHWLEVPVPSTGDNTPIALTAGLLLLSGVALITLRKRTAE